MSGDNSSDLDAIAAVKREQELVCELMTFSVPKSEREWAIVRYIHQMRQDWMDDQLPFHRALMRIAYDAKSWKEAREIASNALSRVPEKDNER